MADWELQGDPRVQQALDATGLPYETDENGDFKLELTLKEGRAQAVFVNSSTEKLGNLELRHVWSGAAVLDEAIDPRLAVLLLERNTEVTAGAWSIVQRGGKTCILYGARVAADCDGPTLATVIRFVTETADALEADLSDKDRF
jgi:hypothetical protein